MQSKIEILRPGPLDIHAHVVPESLLKRLAGSGRAGFGAERSAAGVRLVIGGVEARRPLMRGMHETEPRLQVMHEQGVSAQVLSPWIGLVNDTLPAADGLWLADAVNESIAELVREMPDRFAGIGSAPLAAPAETAERLAGWMRDYGLLGFEINTMAGPDRLLDDPSLEPFWAAAEEAGALIMIHPSLGGSGKRFEPYYLNNLIHNPLETTAAGAHLIFGGVMERHPRLKVLLVHGGGYLPYGLGRLRRGRLVRDEAQVSMTGSVEESFQRFYFDTVTHGAAALGFLVGQVGAGHVMMGTDYPFDMADPDPVATVRDAALGEAMEALVLRGAAEKVF